MNIESIINDLNSIKRTSFGISIPDLRVYAKKLAKSDYKTFILNNPKNTFELKLLHAFLIGYIKDDIKILLKYFEDFIPFVDSWEVNDSLCQNFKIARIYQKEVWNMIVKYSKSDKEFESRIVSVILLSHFVNDEYIDNVLDILDKLNTDKYYSQMGVAWAIATIMAKYPQKCFRYLKKCNLNKTTFKKTLQKIRESYRVSADMKKMLTEYLNQAF